MPGDPPTLITASRDVTITTGVAPTVTTAVRGGHHGRVGFVGWQHYFRRRRVGHGARRVLEDVGQSDDRPTQYSNGTGAGEFASSISGLSVRARPSHDVRRLRDQHNSVPHTETMSASLRLPAAPVVTAATGLTPDELHRPLGTARPSATGVPAGRVCQHGFTGFVDGATRTRRRARATELCRQQQIWAAGTTYYYRVRAYKRQWFGPPTRIRPA